MTQPALNFDGPAVSERRRRRPVVRTSVEAGRAVNRDGRIMQVIDWLRGCGHQAAPATSAEMAIEMFGLPYSLSKTLYVRRGLSDALARGFVEHAGERVCAVSGRTCVTWRLRTR